ncbi:unnamed protein product [Zymoseptoria tritici ST99CH_3D7]|uniref:Uncharacterized protein n=1 Tax=Zymoseptoria tritici (strain ST99CH_3D7) TaxID=1276538 RepID=A0A1X7RQW9_ZYMT9|nr:unnamed protein product [Zymoseptoria tritici ST99CH_3D7]
MKTSRQLTLAQKAALKRHLSNITAIDMSPAETKPHPPGTWPPSGSPKFDRRWQRFIDAAVDSAIPIKEPWMETQHGRLVKIKQRNDVRKNLALWKRTKREHTASHCKPAGNPDKARFAIVLHYPPKETSELYQTSFAPKNPCVKRVAVKAGFPTSEDGISTMPENVFITDACFARIAVPYRGRLSRPPPEELFHSEVIHRHIKFLNETLSDFHFDTILLCGSSTCTTWYNEAKLKNKHTFVRLKDDLPLLDVPAHFAVEWDTSGEDLEVKSLIFFAAHPQSTVQSGRCAREIQDLAYERGMAAAGLPSVASKLFRSGITEESLARHAKRTGGEVQPATGRKVKPTVRYKAPQSYATHCRNPHCGLDLTTVNTPINGRCGACYTYYNQHCTDRIKPKGVAPTKRPEVCGNPACGITIAEGDGVGKGECKKCYQFQHTHNGRKRSTADIMAVDESLKPTHCLNTACGVDLSTVFQTGSRCRPCYDYFKGPGKGVSDRTTFEWEARRAAEPPKYCSNVKCGIDLTNQRPCKGRCGNCYQYFKRNNKEQDPSTRRKRKREQGDV